MSPRAAAVVVVSLLATLGVLVAGCAEAPAPEDVAAVRPVPAGTTVLPAGAPTAPPDTSCGDPTASLQPTGPLPAPGAMPSGSAMDRIVARGALVVGVDQNAPPFGYRDPATGALAGSDVALAKEMARAILGDPEKVQFRTESSGQRIPNLTSGADPVDLVVQTLTATCERRQQIEFSTAYFTAQQKLMVPRASSAQTLADLGSAPGRPPSRVCTIAGTTAVRSIQSAPSPPTAVTVPQNSDCLVLLQQGQADGIVTDDTILGGFAQQDPRVAIRDQPIGDGEPYVVGVSRDHPDLVRFVNGVLERLRADGTLARLYAPAVIPPASSTPPPARYRG